MINTKSIAIIGINLCFCLVSPAKAEVITLRADVWCPFNCEPKATQPGYLIEIAKIALAKQKTEVDYQTLNWARAIVESRDKKFTGIVGSAKSDAPDFVFPEVPMGVAKNCIFTKSDSSWTYNGPESLSKIVIATIKNYTYGDDFDAYVVEQVKDPKIKSKIDTTSGDNALELNYKKLQIKRVDGLIEEQGVLKNFLFTKKLDEKTIRNAGCVKEDFIYIAFGPKEPNAKVYAKLLGDTVVEMRKDGRLKKLLDTYGLVDWQK